jgi:hypothetical protein
MSQDRNLQGGCDCGAVRYRMTSEPLFVNCCHCRWCQRESGSAFALNAMIEAERVVLTKGEPEMVDTPSNSGKGQKIYRCPTCRIAVWSNYAGAGARGAVRSRRHARQSRSAAARHPHLHLEQAALGGHPPSGCRQCPSTTTGRSIGRRRASNGGRQCSLVSSDVGLEIAKRGAQAFLHDRMVERHREHLRHRHPALQRPREKVADVLRIGPHHFGAEENPCRRIRVDAKVAVVAQHGRAPGPGRRTTPRRRQG